MKIAFKDSSDGVYQIEVESEAELPDWVRGMTRLTETQRLEAAAAAEAAISASKGPKGVIENIERGNPHTHRSLRESPLFMDAVIRQLHAKVNALDAEVAALTGRAPAPMPAIPETHMIRAIRAVDDAIKAERAKL